MKYVVYLCNVRVVSQNGDLSWITKQIIVV